MNTYYVPGRGPGAMETLKDEKSPFTLPCKLGVRAGKAEKQLFLTLLLTEALEAPGE